MPVEALPDAEGRIAEALPKLTLWQAGFLAAAPVYSSAGRSSVNPKGLHDQRDGDAGSKRLKLVDLVLSRISRKGLLAEVAVLGEEDEAINDPDWNDSSHERPVYE